MSVAALADHEKRDIWILWKIDIKEVLLPEAGCSEQARRGRPHCTERFGSAITLGSY